MTLYYNRELESSKEKATLFAKGELRMVNDDVFEKYAAQQEAEANEAAKRGNGSQGAYTEIAWTGLSPKDLKIVRAVGGPPDSNIDVTTAKSVRVAWIVGDDGKKFRCILPERSDAPDHPLWRIITRVKATEWDDGKKSFPVQQKHPQVYNIVEKNGLTEGDKAYIFDRGWTGRQVLIMNVIDREQMAWHRENKHTMLLSRNIGEGKDGTKFPEEGVPVYGFSSHLANLFKFYKSWEKYDIGILRTGQKETPYRIINASKYIEEVPEHKRGLVVEGPLSAEEASWDRYDLNKLFGVTSYTKIYNRLQLTIARIDASLGTHFIDEFKELVDKEKAAWEAQREDEEDKEALSTATPGVDLESEPDPEPEPKKAPKRREVKSQAEESAGFDTSFLKGWDKSSVEERLSVKGITVKNGKLVDIEYKDPNVPLLACPSCEMPGTETATVCIGCGLSFG